MGGKPLRVALQKIVPYLWAVVVIAALYVVWVFASRHQANRDIERMLERKALRAMKPFDDGGKGLKILHFYASKGQIFRGERVTICYGVRDAREVRIEPPIEPLKPMWNRCLTVEPQRTTRYRLTAESESGEAVSESFEVKVTPPRE